MFFSDLFVFFIVQVLLPRLQIYLIIIIDVQPSQISTSRKKFVKLNLKSLNNKSNHQQIPSNRSGQIIAQPSDANQQVYSPTIGRSGGHLHAKWPKTQSTIKTQVKSTSSIEDRSQYLGTSQNSFNQVL